MQPPNAGRLDARATSLLVNGKANLSFRPAARRVEPKLKQGVSEGQGGAASGDSWQDGCDRRKDSSSRYQSQTLGVLLSYFFLKWTATLHLSVMHSLRAVVFGDSCGPWKEVFGLSADVLPQVDLDAFLYRNPVAQLAVTCGPLQLSGKCRGQ